MRPGRRRTRAKRVRACGEMWGVASFPYGGGDRYHVHGTCYRCFQYQWRPESLVLSSLEQVSIVVLQDNPSFADVHLTSSFPC